MRNTRNFLIQKVNKLDYFTTTAFLLVVISFGVAACPTSKTANNSNSSETANQVNSAKKDSLFDGKILFTPPADFKPAAREEFASKLAENSQPQYIFTNADRTAYVIIELINDLPFQIEELPKLKNTVEKEMKYSNQSTSEIIAINGKQWLHFEAEDKKPEGELVAPVPLDEKTPSVSEKPLTRHHQYSTSFNGKLLHFTFKSEVKTYPQVKDAFIKSSQTIEIKN